MTVRGPLNVLFLCTANSARSILSEAILNHIGNGQFKAFSAGSQPGSKVHPNAIELLENLGHPTSGLRSKSWEEFAEPGAPIMDHIITVCNNAAGEACPVWPGHPITDHWDIRDPAGIGVTDDERRQTFAQTYRCLESKIQSFVDQIQNREEDMTSKTVSQDSPDKG